LRPNAYFTAKHQRQKSIDRRGREAMIRILRATSVAMLGALIFARAADAQMSKPGPYYALPSWDQQLPASARWITLANWDSGAAVLDRETGLVWQQNPTANSAAATWADALSFCSTTPIGGRYGWRLPSVEEFTTLLDPGSNALFSGNPFTFSYPHYPVFFTATTDPSDNTQVIVVGVNSNAFFVSAKSSSDLVWCVRGYQGTQSPQ
jgi:hypothetical protein